LQCFSQLVLFVCFINCLFAFLNFINKSLIKAVCILIVCNFYSCIGPEIQPPPPDPLDIDLEETTISISSIFANGCNLIDINGQPYTVVVEVWSNSTQNGHHKIGNSITKTQNDFISGSGEINFKIDVPNVGGYYLEIEITSKCSDCCGDQQTFNPQRCTNYSPPKFRGRQFWKMTTEITNFPQNPIHYILLNRCICDCN